MFIVSKKTAKIVGLDFCWSNWQKIHQFCHRRCIEQNWKKALQLNKYNDYWHNFNRSFSSLSRLNSSKKTPNLRKIYHFNSQICHFFIAVHSYLSMAEIYIFSYLCINKKKYIFQMSRTFIKLIYNYHILGNCI